jgi:hypothetical protein
VRRALHALATAVVIAAAAWMWHALPTPDDVYGPFEVDAGIGQQASGRGIETRVTGARIAPRIDKKQPPRQLIDAVGIWIVIDGEAMATRTGEMPTAELMVGADTYVPTARVGVFTLKGALVPGIVLSGSWVFDVPADVVVSGARPISLRVWIGDGRLDSRLVTDIALDGPHISRSDVVALEPATQAGT